MSVITISRGTFSGGKMLAECLGQRLGYRCIDRDDIVQKASARGASERELRSALEQAPSSVSTMNHKKYVYLALVQAALAEEVRNGHAIYHGLAGQLLLKGGIGVLRLRIIAPMEFRIRMAQERLGLARDDVIAQIRKIDEDRRKWTRYLYGVDWEDPSLHDLVINLEHISIDQACRLAAGMAMEAAFEFSPESKIQMDNLALASRVRAEMALNPFTSNLEVEVEAHGGEVTIKGNLFDEADDVEKVARSVPGVISVTVEDLAAGAVAAAIQN
jgi:cytidylate kinase